ncbi:MAG: ribosome-binding factor A [Bacteroidetes bacterium]|nr:ribosome-binding factor A [Bacteroidota bacterium]
MNKRQQKFSRLIQKELSCVFQQECQNLFKDILITVIMVNVSPDLKVADVYLSLLLFGGQNNKESHVEKRLKDGDKPDTIIEKINAHGKRIRQLLAMRIKDQVKKIPELVFLSDDTGEYASNIDKLLSNLNIPPEEN